MIVEDEIMRVLKERGVEAALSVVILELRLLNQRLDTLDRRTVGQMLIGAPTP